MKKKFLIFTPTYNENNGGSIVLHKLCSILNGLGYKSYVYPAYSRFHEIEKNSSQLTLKALLGFLKRVLVDLYKEHEEYRKFKTNPAFNTPIFNEKNKNFNDDWIVVYPERIFGNPLNATNVVRWLLHNPGYHTGKIFYGQNEFLIKFNSAITDFSFPSSITSKQELKVIHYPLEFYNTEDIPKVRTGTAYCLRKGRNKPIQHDLTDSILIDGKSHAEIAAIFKQVKTFISYDTLTAYSLFAVLCGCDSIVIPDDGVTEKKWYPNPKDRQGLSYGFNGLEQARKTAHFVKQYVTEEEGKSIENVKKFILETESFFC